MSSYLLYLPCTMGGVVWLGSLFCASEGGENKASFSVRPRNCCSVHTLTFADEFVFLHFSFSVLLLCNSFKEFVPKQTLTFIPVGSLRVGDTNPVPFY